MSTVFLAVLCGSALVVLALFIGFLWWFAKIHSDTMRRHRAAHEEMERRVTEAIKNGARFTLKKQRP